MIRTVYAEAGGENEDSKLAVAEVIRNRANNQTPNSNKVGYSAIFKGKDTHKDVVTKKGQFESVMKNVTRYSDPHSAAKDSKRRNIEERENCSS